MRRLRWVLVVVFAAAGCAGGTIEDASDPGAETETEAAFSNASGLLYFYVTPTEPGSTNPLALRRANAKPTTLSPTYGLPILPDVRLAHDARTTQAALDAVLATSYEGNGTRAVALFGSRDVTASAGVPTQEVVENSVPSQPVSVSSVQQRDALFTLPSASSANVTVRLVNEKDFPAAASSAIAFDYAASTTPAATKAAVQGGAMFTGAVDVKCSKVLWWTTCKPPTAVHAAAYYSAR
jgi:hypothetical protein